MARSPSQLYLQLSCPEGIAKQWVVAIHARAAVYMLCCMADTMQGVGGPDFGHLGALLHYIHIECVLPGGEPTGCLLGNSAQAGGINPGIHQTMGHRLKRSEERRVGKEWR